MNTTDAFQVAQAVLFSLGGGSLIVFVLSSYLGKIWATRILQNEKHEHNKELSEFKSRLNELEKMSSLNYQEKIELYKVVSTPLVQFIAHIDKDGLTEERLNTFNVERLKISAQLALFAPHNVFDAFNNMIDYLYDSIEQRNFCFDAFRDTALFLLSEMRKDIGIFDDNIKYNGHRKNRT